MGQILVRGIDDETKGRLRTMAARRGNSIEGLVRDILFEAVSRDMSTAPHESLSRRIQRIFAGTDLRPGEIQEIHGGRPEVPDFGE